MPLDLEEQEQLESLKHWWRDNGNVVTWIAIVVLLAVAGWFGWKNWQRKQAGEASVLYEQVQKAVDSTVRGFEDVVKVLTREAKKRKEAAEAFEGAGRAEKAELERQFSDLALLRDQIRKLKDELSIARRLEWIRRGLYGPEPKGTEKLQPGFAAPAGGTNFDLNVEIRQDGGAKVLPPPTNAPPQ